MEKEKILQEYIWVCNACGKTAKKKFDFNDSSCILNSFKCKPEKEKHPETGELVWVALDNQEPEEEEDNE